MLSSLYRIVAFMLLIACYFFVHYAISDDIVAVQGIPSLSNSGLMAYMEQSDGFTIRLLDWNDGQTIALSYKEPVFEPKLSEDGKKLFYLKLAEQIYYSELWCMDIDSKIETRLTDYSYGDIYGYSVSSDCSNIFFFASDDNRIGKLHCYLISFTDSIPVIRDVAELENIDGGTFLTPIFARNDELIIFAFDKSIYVIDINSFQIREAKLAYKAYQLSGSNDPSFCIFTANTEGIYQIFLFNIDDGYISQLTHTETNKFSPFMNDNGDLYYIDCGMNWNFMNLTWENLLAAKNTRYGLYDNKWGKLAWQGSRVLEFLLLSYESFGDPYFLDLFNYYANFVLDNTDKERGIYDYSDKSKCGWSSTRYSLDLESNLRFAVHTGMICVPLSDFASLCLNNSFLRGRYGKTLTRLLDVLPGFVKAHDEEFVDYENDTLSIIENGEGYYIYPRNSPIGTDGINVPFNQQNRMGEFLIELYGITGDSEYLDKARKLWNTFKRHLIDNGELYEWHYHWGLGYSGWDEDDNVSTNAVTYAGLKGYDGPSYTSLEFAFICRLFRYGLVADADMEKFFNTYLYSQNNRPDTVRVGKMLAQCKEEYRSEILAKSQNEDIFGSREYINLSIPSMSEICQRGIGDRWALKRITTSGREENIYLKDEFLSFVISQNNLYCVHKKVGGSYYVRRYHLDSDLIDYIKGDVDGDGTISVKDALLVLKISVGLIDANPQQNLAADMNDDGRIRADDAILILNQRVKPIPPEILSDKYSGQNVRITLDKTYDHTSNMIDVFLNLDNPNPVKGGELRIEYDDSLLAFDKLLPHSNILFTYNEYKKGIIYLSFVINNGMSGECLTRIRFQVLGKEFGTNFIMESELFGVDTMQLMNVKKIYADHISGFPETTTLLQNYPNPINPHTWIPFLLDVDSDVTISIYSASGELVRELPLGYKKKGIYLDRTESVCWDGRDRDGIPAASGVYFYSISTGIASCTRKLVVLH